MKEFYDQAVPPFVTLCAYNAGSRQMDFHQTIEKAHGRVKTRLYWQSTDIDWFADKSLW